MLLALWLLAGCASQPSTRPQSPSLNLLPPAEGVESVLLKQKVTMLAAQGQQQFLAVARFDRQNLKLVVLLPSGQRLLTLDYDGEKLRQQNDIPL